MKKLIIKIGNERHELPYNGEEYSVEVSEKYVPKVGDCVKVESRILNKSHYYWFKIKKVVDGFIDYSFMVREDLKIVKSEFFIISKTQFYTQITPEELKAKYAEAGYEWDYETDTIKPLKWMPKYGDDVWFLNIHIEPERFVFDKDNYEDKKLLKKGLLFPTKAECQKFADYCWSYFENKNK